MNDLITDATLAIPTRSVIVGHTTGGGGGYINVKVNPSGAVSAAVTAADGDVFVRSNAAATFPVTATQGPANATPWNENVAQVGGAAVQAAAAESAGSAPTDVVPLNRTVPSTAVVPTVATWNSATALNTAVTILSGSTDNVTFSYTQSGVFATGAITIEYTIDGTNWKTVPKASLNFGTTLSGTGNNPITLASIDGTVGVIVYNAGYQSIRLRLSTAITGTGSPTIVISSTTGKAFPITPIVGLVPSGQAVAGGAVLTGASTTVTGGTLIQSQSAYQVTDGLSTSGLFGAYGAVALFNGATWDRPRTPKVFTTKSSATASGDTAVWTPAAGKKFRVMRFMIAVQGLSTTAAGGTVAITLRDATSAILHTFNINVPAVALTGAALLYESNWIDLGNGYLSAVANNVLNVNLGTAFTAGGVDVFVAGTEE